MYFYRRDEEHMPARKIELQEAVEDGVNPEFKTKGNKKQKEQIEK